MITEIHVRETL